MAYCAYCGSYIAQVSFVPCTSCGNPSNGAPPRPVVAGGGTNALALIIGIVAGGFVLIAIIGILAAIAVPNLLNAAERAKQKRTMADMRTVAVALEQYAVDRTLDAYPPGSYVEELRPLLQPQYLAAMPTLDAWGTGLRYTPLPGRGYAIVSGARDRDFEAQPDQYTPGRTLDFDCDIVFASGKFVQYPEHAGDR